MQESEQYQYPAIFRRVEFGYATVRTFVGDKTTEITLRVSPRISEPLKVDVLDRMEKDLRAQVEPLLQHA